MLSAGTLKNREMPAAVPTLREKPDQFEAEMRVLREIASKEKPMIYRPGQVPVWADDDDREEPTFVSRRTDIGNKLKRKNAPFEKQKAGDRKKVSVEVVTTGGEIVSKEPKVKAEVVLESPKLKEREREHRNRDAPAPVLVDTSKLAVPAAMEEATEEEDELAKRRERARLKKLQREQEEAAAMSGAEPTLKLEDLEAESGSGGRIMVKDEPRVKSEDGDGAGSDEEESSGSEEEESDEEDRARKQLLLAKPVFVSKKERETLEERKKIEEEEEALEREKELRLQERKRESTKLVIEEIDREEKEKKKQQDEGGEELPDDSDDLSVEDMARELAAWKIREIGRLQRDKEEREKWEREKAEVERRRNLTDEQIAAEDAANPIRRRDRGDMKFLQKYFHPGAFFQDTEGKEKEGDIYFRNFNEPTGADKDTDKLFLPKVMQVKKFGLKGRTKYTHLNDQDTTNHLINPWKVGQDIADTNAAEGKRAQAPRQMAGTGAIGFPNKKRKT